MSITLRTGEYLWSAQGTHVCDANGFATICAEDTVVEFDSPEIESNASAVILADRAFRGVGEDGLPIE